MFAKWADHKRRSASSAATAKVSISRQQQKVEAFIASQGDLPIGSITADHLLAFRDHLKAQTKPSYQDNTIAGYLKAVQAIVSFAVNERLIATNPFHGLKFQLSKKNSKKAAAFQREDLQNLLLAPTFIKLRKNQTSRFWIVLIALFTGARVEEICQLKRKDIKKCDITDLQQQQRSIHYFDINEDDKDKHLKNKSSIRKIPVHPQLLKCGLMEYVERQTDPEAFIFPDLIRVDNRLGHGISKWFSPYCGKHGIEGKRFHSFRATFIDACRDANIHREKYQRMTGHAPENVGDEYGGHSLGRLYSEIMKVDYGIDLSSLYVDGHENITSPHSVRSAPEVVFSKSPKRKPDGIELLNAVPLAEAYQRLGKFFFKDAWVDYQMCIRDNTHGWVSINLSGYVKPNHKGAPELIPLSPTDLAQLPTQPATIKAIDQHKKIFDYLEKGLVSGMVKSYRKYLNSTDYELLDDWHDMQKKAATLPLSFYSVEHENGKKRPAIVLVDSGTLTKYFGYF